MTYELLYIIPSPFTEKDIPEIQKKIDKIINDSGAKILNEENLGNKKFAYPIKHILRGFYILVNFETEPKNIKKIEEKFKLTPEILRYLIIKKKLKEKIETKIESKKEEKQEKEKKENLKTLKEKIDNLLKI